MRTALKINFILWLLIIIILKLSIGVAHAQSQRNPCFYPAANPSSSSGCIPVSSVNPLPVNATVNASVSGFLPSGSYSTLTATASSSASTALPTNSGTVALQNSNSVDISCNLASGAATALTNQIIVRAGSTVFVGTTGYNNIACINQTGSSSNIIVLAGGSGLGSNFGGGGSGGGGGASNITQIASSTSGITLWGTAPTGASVLGVNANILNSSVPVAQFGGWTVTADAGANLNTSALALESGGNLANLYAATGNGAVPAANTLQSRLATINTTLGSPFQAGGSIGNTAFGISGTLPAFAATPTFNCGTGCFQATQPVSGTVAATQSGTWTVQPGNTANTTAWLVTGTGGVFPASQSGTWNLNNVTGTISLPSGASTSANQPTNAAQGSTTAGQTGNLLMGAVTTAAPTYTTAQTSPFSLDTAGNLRVNVAAGGGSGGTSSSFGAVFPGTGTAAGMSQGGNMVALTGTGGNLNVQCANCSGSGASGTDEGAFTAGTSVFAPGGGFFQTTATNNPLTTGQWGAWQMTANRAGFVNLRNASGTEIGTSTTPVQVSLANTATNATAVKVDGSAVTQPISGASSNASSGVATSSTNIPAISFNYGFNGTTWDQLQVDGSKNLKTIVNAALPAGANTIGAVTQASGPWSQNLTQIGGATPSATNPLWMAGAQAASTTMQSAAVANGNGTTLTVTGYQTALVNVNCSVACSGGTTINFEGTDSTGTYFSLAAFPVTGASTAVSSATTSGQFWVPVSGLTTIRARISAYSAGTITVTGTPVFGQNAALSQVANTNANGQQTMANSSPVVIASNQSAITVNNATAANFNATVSQATGTNLHVVCDSGCSGSGGTSSNFGSAFPAAGTAIGLTNGTNMVAWSATSNYGTAPSAIAVPAVNAAVTNVVSENQTQIGGNTISTGNGTSGTGTQRVNISSDNSAVAGFGVGATGSAAPANAMYNGTLQSGATGGLLKGVIQCDQTAIYDASTTGSTQMVALASGQTIYVCGYSITTGGTATNVKLVYGTGSNCATGATNLTPAYQLVANGGIVDRSPFWGGMKTASANALCVNASAANAVQATVYYAQF